MDTTDIEQEKLLAQQTFQDFIDILSTSNLSEDEINIIRRAFNLAVVAHGNTRRKSGELYIFHPLSVAKITALEMDLDCPAIVAAFLHDVVEDTSYSLEYIQEEFGSEIANIVDGLTKISHEDSNEQNGTNQTDTIKKIISSLSYDPRVILVKLADRLHNLRTIDSMTHEKQAKIASETKYIYAPLALRLGYYNIKNELEDLCLKITDPDVYYFINGKIEVAKDTAIENYNKFIEPIKQDIAKDGINAYFTYRFRSINSIWNSMSINKISFDDVDFIFYIKIVIDSPKNLEKFDCWRVYSILSEHYRPKPEGLKDWISTPKANGYESIHSVFLSDAGQWTEVLIRSVRMDDIAEKGVAGLWKHRDASKSETKLEQWINAMIDLMKTSNDNSIEFIESFKQNLFDEEIFVYTPKGEVRTLPKGSTVLDYAYAIHSDLGDKCLGAKINNRLSAISTELKNGDQVEILTSDNQYPKESWLNYAKTPRAVNHIKQAIIVRKKSFYETGKKLVEDWFKENRIDVKDDNFAKLLKLSIEHNLTDLFYNIAIGKSKLDSFKKFIESQDKNKGFFSSLFSFNKTKSNGKTLKDTIQDQVDKNPLSLIITKDTSNLSYDICNICKPIPGDDVVGIINNNNTITIHRTNCGKAVKVMAQYGNRIIKAKWPEQDETAGFLTAITLHGSDRKGLTADLASLIAKHFDINIREITLKASEGLFEGYISLYISNTDALNLLINDIEKINGISKVVRVNRSDGADNIYQL